MKPRSLFCSLFLFPEGTRNHARDLNVEEPVRRWRRAPVRRASKGDKDGEKKPRWNAYLVWFTQRGKEIRNSTCIYATILLCSAK